MNRAIRYYSPPGGNGYGEAALGYMEYLHRQGVALCWSPLVWMARGIAPWRLLPEARRPDPLGPPSTAPFRRCVLPALVESGIDHDTVFLHCVPELWPRLVEPDKINIGYCVWETDRLPDHWPAAIRCVDRVCVPCRFNASLFSVDGGPPVSVVPHLPGSGAGGGRAARDAARDLLGIDRRRLVFYTIGSWTPRKAMWLTLHAYLLAFGAADPVTLVVKTDETGVEYESGRMRPVRDMVAELTANYPDPADVVLFTGTMAADEVGRLHLAGDCYLSLVHSEGWGMGAFDAAVHDRPVIITGWGGQLDFLPPALADLVRFRLEPVREYRNWDSYRANQRWARADIDDAVRLLRRVRERPAEAARRGRALGAHVRRRFGHEESGRLLLAAIDDART